MSNKYLIPAFTIVEAIVSMAVTAIILAIIFVIFVVTSERLADFKKQNQQINDMNRMAYAINKSIFESQKMELSETLLTFNNYQGDIAQYSITEDFFIRIQGEFTDTFYIPTKKIHIDILTNDSKKISYQRLKWDIKANGVATELNFYKKLYANELIKPTYANGF